MRERHPSARKPRPGDMLLLCAYCDMLLDATPLGEPITLRECVCEKFAEQTMKMKEAQ